MSAGRCQRRMMMGRGADGGCGTEEKTCPVARVSGYHSQEPSETLKREKDSPVQTSGVNLYEQAFKTLTERSPFGAEDQAAAERVATLPVALAVSLSKHSDSRRKHKNPHADQGQKAIPSTATSASVVSKDVWAETQEYFRPIIMSDIDHLIPKTVSADDPCLRIPFIRFCSGKATGLKGAREHAGAILKEQPELVINEEEASITGITAVQGEQLKMKLDRNPMDVDNDIADKCDVVHDVAISEPRPGEQNEGFSLRWLLQLKNRSLLTSERPNKKRRLLGNDAGLERLLSLPQSKGHDLPRCDYCCIQGSLSASDQLLSCANCKVFVHQQCYGIGAVPTGTWLCSRCQHLEAINDTSNENEEFHCLLCPKKGGALKPVGGASPMVKQKCKFVHLFCSLWVPELYVDNTNAMEPVMNIESVPETRKKLACNVCKLKGGVCIRCSNGTCRTSFHPMCAREAKHKMEVWGRFGCDNVELRVFCLKHSELLEVGPVHSEIVGVSGNNCSKPSSTSTENEPPEMKFSNRVTSGAQRNAPNQTSGQVGETETYCNDTLIFKSNSHDAEKRLKEELNGSDVENVKQVADESSRDPMVFPVLKKLTERQELKIHDAPQGSKLMDYMQASPLASNEFVDLHHVIPMNIKADGAAEVVPNQHILDDWSAKVSSTGNPCDELACARVIRKVQLIKKDSSWAPQSDFDSYIHPLVSKRLFGKAGYYIYCRKTSQGDDNSESKEFTKVIDTEVVCSDTANSFRLQELPAEDEVERELASLQNRLLDTYFAIKSQYGNLMVKLVRAIADETDDIRKQRWDAILVNRFLRETREAKKRGRKEKRLREAQAILATAAAATASSRLSSTRKVSNDETVEAGQEDNNKVDATSGSGGSNSSIGHQIKGNPSKVVGSKLSLAKTSDVSVACCDVCQRAETPMNPIFICGGCKVAVHLDCYRRGREPISSWFCEPCMASRSISTDVDCGDGYFVSPACSLCGTSNGAFRKSSDERWVHAFCAEWVLGTRYRRGQEQPVEGFDDLLKAKGILICCLCHQNVGVTVKCCYGHCQAAFHPICARRSSFYLNSKIIGGSTLHRKAYCGKHSQEQREKSNFEQIGVEEFKSLRQIRVELEKLRLLCERIVKREKLKRECVLCSHEILASRRDYMTFSVIMRSPLFSSGLSSESATTSVNNTSYSGTVERSDDVTVDSTLSGKSKAVLPLHLKIDKANDRSRSNLSMLPAAVDRISFAGKQLPQRPPSFHTATIQERKFKSRKPPEALQDVRKALGQASLQNQRLPKGLTYMPLNCLSKSHDTGSHDSHKPDG